MILMNAPPNGDMPDHPDWEEEPCRIRMLSTLARHGLILEAEPSAAILTRPRAFAARFPGSAGALYGMALQGPMAVFRRPGARTKVPGLYLAGGSAHPGAGVPMAALSGRLAAKALIVDGVSIPHFRPAAMPGGMSMP